MNLIYLIKIINLIALMFVPLNYLFGVFGYSNSGVMIYIWLCFIGYIINYLYRKNNKLTALSLVVLFIPLGTAKSKEELIYAGAYCIMTIIIISKGMVSIKYDSELDIFRKGIYICSGTFVLSLLGGTKLFSSNSSYYVIIYIVTSILLLRNLRFMEYNKEDSTGKKINFRYSIILVGASIFLSIGNVRDMVIGIIKGTYLYLTNFLMYLFSWLILGIGYILSEITNFLIALMERAGFKAEGKDLRIFQQKLEVPKGEEGEALAQKLFDNLLFQTFVKVILIAVIGFILIKVFSNMTTRRDEQEDYLEEREFISKSERGSKSIRKSILHFIKGKSSEEKVRLYYQKYLKKCMDNGIELDESDTTEDINNKSQSKFDNMIIGMIREVYIKIRYGEKKATYETVKKMEEYYNNIKKP